MPRALCGAAARCVVGGGGHAAGSFVIKVGPSLHCYLSAWEAGAVQRSCGCRVAHSGGACSVCRLGRRGLWVCAGGNVQGHLVYKNP